MADIFSSKWGLEPSDHRFGVVLFSWKNYSAEKVGRRASCHIILRWWSSKFGTTHMSLRVEFWPLNRSAWPLRGRHWAKSLPWIDLKTTKRLWNPILAPMSYLVAQWERSFSKNSSSSTSRLYYYSTHQCTALTAIECSWRENTFVSRKNGHVTAVLFPARAALACEPARQPAEFLLEKPVRPFPPNRPISIHLGMIR